MNFTVPSNDEIQKAFPQIESIAMLDQCGFKVVYRVGIGGKIEAFQLILIP